MNFFLVFFCVSKNAVNILRKKTIKRNWERQTIRENITCITFYYSKWDE